MRTMVKLIAVIAMLCMGIGEGFAYDSSYQSLFAITKRDLFCSYKEQIKGIPGIPGVGGCVNPDIYSYMENRAGFRVRNNPDDARIVCNLDYPNVDYPDADSCNPKPSALIFGDGIRQDIRLFRIYVPEGATSVRLELFIPGMVPMAAAVQFGQPPVSGLSSDYSSMNGYPLNLKDCITSARMVRSFDGTIGVVNDTSLGSDKSYLTVPRLERWLYVKVFDYGGGYIQTIKYIVSVNYEQYRDWYRTMQPQDWKTLGEEGSDPDIISPDAPSSSGTNTGTGTGATTPVPDAFGGSGGSNSLLSGGSSNTIPTAPIYTGATTLADILAASLKQQIITTPSIPVFNQAIQMQKAADITVPTLITWSQSTVDLKPALNMPISLLNTQVKVYAAYINPDGKIYIANSNSVFQLYQGGDIPVYFTTTIRSDVWPLSSEGINPFSSLAGTVALGRSYIFGVTPSNVSSSPQQFIDNFWGTWFQLTPPTSTSTSTQCGTVFGCGT